VYAGKCIVFQNKVSGDGKVKVICHMLRMGTAELVTFVLTTSCCNSADKVTGFFADKIFSLHKDR
jgi:hypothetical protein